MCFILKLSIFCFFLFFFPSPTGSQHPPDRQWLCETRWEKHARPAITFCFNRLNLNGLICWLVFFSFFFSWPLCCSSFTLYLFLYILPFHYIPLILFPFIHFFLSFLFFSSSLFLSWLWRISPDHSDPSKEEVIHWNTLLVSCLYLTKSFTDVA